MKKLILRNAALLAMVLCLATPSFAAVTANVGDEDFTASFHTLMASTSSTVGSPFGSFTLHSAVVDGSGANAGIRAYLYQVSVPSLSRVHSIEMHFSLPVNAAILPINLGAPGPVEAVSINTVAGGNTRYNATLASFGFENNIPGGQAVDDYTVDLVNSTIRFTRANNFSNLTPPGLPPNVSIIFGVFKSAASGTPGGTNATVVVRDANNTAVTQVSVLAPALTALPEPGTILLAGMGGLSFLAHALRRRLPR